MPIIIEPWKIPEGGKDYAGEEAPQVVALEKNAGAEAVGPIQYELQALYVSHELIVTGTVAADIRFVCSRCADSFTERVEDHEFFCEKEVLNVHETLDLTDEVRETIILRFPNYPVCGEACRGLCPRCGVNLNRERCECKPLEAGRWSAFSELDSIEVKNGSSKKKNIES